MARIRTVKPELWTDPEFIECSVSARLLLIALLNFATDYGVLPDKPKQLKMQCLPADSVDIDALISELIEQHFIVRTTAPNGDKVLVIRTFAKNQKINRRTLGRWGNPENWGETHGGLSEDSVRTHGARTPGRDNSDNSDNTDSSDSSDLPTSETSPTVAKSQRARRREIVECIAVARADRAQPRSRANWIKAVREDVEANHGDRIADLMAGYPNAPASVIAAAIEGDGRSLSYYAMQPDTPTEPDRRLTAEERAELIAQGKSTTEEV